MGTTYHRFQCRFSFNPGMEPRTKPKTRLKNAAGIILKNIVTFLSLLNSQYSISLPEKEYKH
jgi:hypothetical protein